jgi:hypothetical protein
MRAGIIKNDAFTQSGMIHARIFFNFVTEFSSWNKSFSLISKKNKFALVHTLFGTGHFCFLSKFLFPLHYCRRWRKLNRATVFFLSVVPTSVVSVESKVLSVRSAR